MKITRIAITNLRAIDKLELDLAAGGERPLDLTMLAGPNGCGKTSVLEACLWAFNQDTLVPRALPQQDYSIKLDIHYRDQQYCIVRNPESHVIVTARDRGRTTFPKKGLPKWLDVKALYFPSWRAPRLIGSVRVSTGKGKLHSPIVPQESLGRLKQHLVNLQALRDTPSLQKTQIIPAPELLDRVLDIWREFYPGRGSRFEIDLATEQRANASTDDANGTEDESLDQLVFDLFLIDKDRPQGIAVDELSSGEIEVLSMIGAFLLQRSPYDLVLVDEPELHLHPAWHRTMIRVLRRTLPSSQLICATHSEHILDAVYSHERFTLLGETDPRLRLTNQKVVGNA